MARFSAAVATMPTLVDRTQEPEPRTHFIRRSSSAAGRCAISGRALCGAMLVSAGLWALIIFGARQLWLLIH